MTLINLSNYDVQDYQWGRTSTTWKDLIPLRDFNEGFSENDESPQQYYLRLKSRFNIPLEVIDQWLYLHYLNINTINNYGWLNYDQVRFEEILMSFRQLAGLNIIEEYRPYVRTRESNDPFDGFCCNPQDIEYWQTKGTWRVPPIVLDVTTLCNIPEYAEIRGTFQLVEGHSRLGYLLAMFRTGLITDESEHRVYKMYISEENSVLLSSLVS